VFLTYFPSSGHNPNDPHAHTGELAKHLPSKGYRGDTYDNNLDLIKDLAKDPVPGLILPNGQLVVESQPSTEEEKKQAKKDRESNRQADIESEQAKKASNPDDAEAKKKRRNFGVRME